MTGMRTKKPPGEIEGLARGLRVYANTGEKRSGDSSIAFFGVPAKSEIDASY